MRRAVVASLLLHGAVLLAMSRLPERPARAESTIVSMRVEKRKPPPPPPPPPPEVIPPPELKPEKVKVRTVKEIVKEAPPPPPAAPPPPKFAFSVDMASTTEGGGVEVPVVDGGGNMFADPQEKALPTGKANAPSIEPAQMGEGKGGYQITEEPRFLTDESERAPPYPEVAKAQEIEGTVLLRVYVSVDGTVKEVKVLEPLSGGCTEAAVRWARTRWRFSPARAGSEAVGMWITVPVRFVLER